MVTIEQGDGQFQQAGGATQTRNPQQAPGNLQPNGAQGSNLQGVITGTSLFSNPQSGAIIKVSGNSNTSAEALIASESDPKTSGGLSSAQSGAFVGIIALALIIGGFLIIKRLTTTD